MGNVLRPLRTVRECGSGKPAVFVQFVEMESNRQEKGELIRFWEKQGAVVKIGPMVSWAGAVESSNLTIGNRGRCPCYGPCGRSRRPTTARP